jgi:hypothetical protein
MCSCGLVPALTFCASEMCLEHREVAIQYETPAAAPDCWNVLCRLRNGHVGPCSHKVAMGLGEAPAPEATGTQPPPKGRGRDITPLVIADLEARSAQGALKYGEPLRAENGRDALMDAYQEALDLCQYLRQCIEERGW